jgi:hypothetical protein
VLPLYAKPSFLPFCGLRYFNLLGCNISFTLK